MILLRRREIIGGSGAAPVDLGLSVKWAPGNIVKDPGGGYRIGAEAEIGCMFSWGNVVGHNSNEGYDWGTSVYTNPYASSAGASVGTSISSTDAAHDAALACIGSPWHMPSVYDMFDLYEKTTLQWVSNYNSTGVSGWKCIKKTDSSVFIFLPATDGSTGGDYWTSTGVSSEIAYMTHFSSRGLFPLNRAGRNFGFRVRPVQ